MAADNTSRRMFEFDPSLWTLDPSGQAEIKERLGWLNAINNVRPLIPEIISFKNEVLSAGFTKTLLLGMGGSSLAPEVMAKVFLDNVQNGLRFSILDSTDPAQVSVAAAKFQPDETLYIVSSKSGGTAEVNALFNYFWELSGRTGANFIAITDVTVLGADGQTLFQAPFLAVHRSHIVWVIPESKSGEEN